jgi:hypothetical protein
MIWRIAFCIFFLAIGIKTFQEVTADYKYSAESPQPEQLGVIVGTIILCLLALNVKRKKTR